MIATRSSTRDGAIRRAARDLALLLQIARANLPPAAYVCPRCHHVFSRATRLDMRCPGCAAAAAEADSILP